MTQSENLVPVTIQRIEGSDLIPVTDDDEAYDALLELGVFGVAEPLEPTDGRWLVEVPSDYGRTTESPNYLLTVDRWVRENS